MFSCTSCLQSAPSHQCSAQATGGCAPLPHHCYHNGCPSPALSHLPRLLRSPPCCRGDPCWAEPGGRVPEEFESNRAALSIGLLQLLLVGTRRWLLALILPPLATGSARPPEPQPQHLPGWTLSCRSWRGTSPFSTALSPSSPPWLEVKRGRCCWSCIWAVPTRPGRLPLGCQAAHSTRGWWALSQMGAPLLGGMEVASAQILIRTRAG